MKCETRMMFVITNFLSIFIIKSQNIFIFANFHSSCTTKTMMSTRNRRTLSTERTISVVHRFTSVLVSMVGCGL